MKRRKFLHTLGAAGVIGTGAVTNVLSTQQVFSGQATDDDRAYWVQMLSKIAGPLLSALAAGTLKETMPVEGRSPEIAKTRKPYTHLEGFGRLVCGMAPWVELPADGSDEGKLRSKFFSQIERSLAKAVDPGSTEYMNFSDGGQPLVDAAFLALGFIRAPRLWADADLKVRTNTLAALRKTRTIHPPENNWLLFSAMIETFFMTVGEDYERSRIDDALRKHEQWYKGDGVFGDGPEFHWDYYNSFVIQPFLTTIAPRMAAVDTSYASFNERCSRSAVRYAAILEKLVAPDGSYPAIGRSIAYRCGAFHLLAHQALAKKLPGGLAGAQARCALTAVIRRTLDGPENFDDKGWLRPGLSGHQPNLAEEYISTGSLYLCTTAFLPLGLPATDEFWTSPRTAVSSVNAWGGTDINADKALKL